MQILISHLTYCPSDPMSRFVFSVALLLRFVRQDWEQGLPRLLGRSLVGLLLFSEAILLHCFLMCFCVYFCLNKNCLLHTYHLINPLKFHLFSCTVCAACYWSCCIVFARASSCCWSYFRLAVVVTLRIFVTRLCVVAQNRFLSHWCINICYTICHVYVQ